MRPEQRPSPLLFNLYISDVPPTTSRKLSYADNNALAAQSEKFSECEVTLNKDLVTLENSVRMPSEGIFGKHE